MPRVIRLAVSAALLGWLCPAAFSQGNTFGSIVGVVKVVKSHSETGRIEVKLYNSGGVPLVTYTEPDGRYVFSDLQFGSYTLAVEDERFQGFRQTVLIGNLTIQNAFVNVWLVPKDAEKKADDAAVSSGANPYMISASDFLKSYPKAAVKAFQTGVRQRQAGHWEDAVLAFKQALDAAPGFYEARNNLGTVYLDQGFLPAAEVEFRRVIQEQQSDAIAYFNLGNICLLTGRLEESERTLQEGLRRQPNSAFGLFVLGTVYNRTGKSKVAESTLQNALVADPSLSRVHLELVNLYLNQQNQAKAIEELELFLGRFPKDPMAPKAKEVLLRLSPAQTK